MNDDNKTVYIYGLFDPRLPDNIRYIGKTYQLKIRIWTHIKSASNKNEQKTYRINWIKKLAKENIQPDFKILEECNMYNWEERESYWIAKLKSEGHKLTNATSGGDGCNNPTPELRKKLSDSHKGNKSRLGIPHTEEMKKHFSKIRKGRPGTEAEKQRMIEYNKSKGKGYTLSEEHKKKISKSGKGRIISKETREKMSKINKGRLISETQKKMHSETMKKNAPKYDFNGTMMSILEASKLYNVNVNTLRSKISNNILPSIAILSKEEFKKYKLNIMKHKP